MLSVTMAMVGRDNGLVFNFFPELWKLWIVQDRNICHVRPESVIADSAGKLIDHLAFSGCILDCATILC
jgi:hypothetical protein